jgi:hypothetical protein
LLGGAWPAEAGIIPDERAVNIALQWVKPGEVSGLAIAMYCRPDGASNAEVLKTGAKTVHLGDAAVALLEALPRVKDNPNVIVGKKEKTHHSGKEREDASDRPSAPMATYS